VRLGSPIAAALLAYRHGDPCNKELPPRSQLTVIWVIILLETLGTSWAAYVFFEQTDRYLVFVEVASR
jgi:hypothetical protein